MPEPLPAPADIAVSNPMRNLRWKRQLARLLAAFDRLKRERSRKGGAR